MPIQLLDSSVLQTFAATFAALKEQGILTPIVTLGGLRASLRPEQQTIVDQIISLKPLDYGVKTPYAGELEPAPDDFKDTVEYAWLRRHGNDFGFYESWLEGNEFNMRAEPWHWQYLGGAT